MSIAMKKIGIIGGMSPESTVVYYREINRYVNRRCGGDHSAELVLYNVQYQDIKDVHRADDWAAAARILGDAGRALAAAGADFLVLATNTMHLVAPAIERASGLPLLHIAEVTADALIGDGVRTVGLLGTRFTMERAFYRDVLVARGLEVVVPDPTEIDEIHRIINEELIRGVLLDRSRRIFVNVIASLARRGVTAVILGCTEIGLLVGPRDGVVPVYDTTLLHVAAAAERALGRDPSTTAGERPGEGGASEGRRG
jgi:aspartate racemase